MPTKKDTGQLDMFGLDGSAGKMSWDVSAVDPTAPPGKISGSSSRRSAELLTAPYLYLDLREGYGNLLGPYWEINSPLLGEYTTLNTGMSRSGASASSLSRILEATPHPKYYLSRTACLGILRRAKKRGKELPPVLKQALELQAGIRTEDA